MKSERINIAGAFYLRMAIAAAYLWEVSDRVGLLGKPGSPHVGWGDWQHFMAYARQVMSFLPLGWVSSFAVVASLAEACIGLLLLFGLFTRYAAIGSALLSFCFAIAMATSFGIDSPLGYSVFTLSAASLLLAGQPIIIASADNLLRRQKTGDETHPDEAGRFTQREKLNCLLTFIALTFAASLHAQQHSVNAELPKIKDTTILEQALNMPGIKQKNVQVVLVTFPPGTQSSAHRHTCPTFGYVLQGEIESVFENKYHLYKRGDSFYEQPYGLHSVTRNHDPVDTVKLLVFFIADQHQPNTIHLKN